MKYKVVNQPNEMSCGVACLSTICAFYGIKDISLAALRNIAQLEKNGTGIYTLLFVAEKLNLHSEEIKCENLEELFRKKVNVPIIAQTLIDGLYSHYVVVFEVSEKKVVIGDPAQGQIEMTPSDFEKIWTKKGIILRPTENFKETRKYRKNYQYIVSLVLKFKKELFIAGVFTGVITGISAISTQFYSFLLDKIVPNNDLWLLLKEMLVIGGILILTVELNLMKEKFWIKFNKKLDRELVVKIYNRITNLPLSFFSTRTNGDVNARYHDGDVLRLFITSWSLSFVTDLGYAIWAAILIIRLNWQMFIIAITMEEMMLLIQVYYSKKTEKLTRELAISSTKLDSFVIESFDASETVKNYTAERVMEDEMQTRFVKYQNDKYHSSIQDQVQSSLVTVVNNIGNIFMLATLGIFVMSGDMTVGELMKAYMYVNYIFQPVNFIIWMRSQTMQTSAALERLDDVFNTYTEEELNKKRKNLPENIEKIEFDHVQFRYGVGRKVLEDISFKVKKGESIGIVGETGCGKTTLTKLILGFYPPTGGMIKINDRDIDDYTTSSIRQKIAYISQSDYWFNDTIYNNLIIGNQKATVEELNECCRIAQIDDFVRKSEHGYNTMLDEGATNLATGERQRLSIAKALVPHPDVLILDESTSNLDAKTEEYLIDELNNEKDKIKMIIAHRLNTLRHCDKIIVIKDGRVAEFGTPQELVDKKGLFYDFWKAQKGTY